MTYYLYITDKEPEAQKELAIWLTHKAGEC